MTTLTELVRTRFTERYGTDAALYASPGRINLIGEHTDYNGGYVLPAAVDKGIVAAIRPNGTGRVRLTAIDLGEECAFGLDEEDKPEAAWARYVFGVCRETIKRGGRVEGFDACFAGDVPLGAGMSSSAALESTFAFALNDLFGNGLDRFELARIGQATEHNYCGCRCGIMDQFASVFGRRGCLMRLDCRSLEFVYVPFDPAGFRLVLLDTCVKHQLVGSPYNDRRRSCERVAAALGRELLRGATPEELEAVRPQLSDEDYRRARYVIGEERRVLAFCEALERGDGETAGAAMYATHRGLSQDYEVSCEELDFLVETAAASGVAGARMMGGGFGGCTINLVREERYDDFVATACARFAERYGHAPKVYDVTISDGARRL